MSKNMKIPQLRFKEFSREWEEKKLNEITTYVDYRGKTPVKTEKGIFLVTAKNIKKGFIDYITSKEYISKDDYENVMSRGKPKIGDILLTTEAPLGNVAQVDKKNIALAQRVIKFRGNELLNNSFLKHYMLGEKFQRLLESKAIGTTVLGIQGKVLHKLSLTIPSKQEQEKIASFLTQVDTKIEQLTKKAKLLSDYKKGIMQKIFSQEIRFKDENGKDYANWEENQLLIKIISGNTYPLDSYSQNGTLLIQGLNIYPNELILNNPIYIEDSFNSTNHVIINKNDILIGLNRPLVNKKLKVCIFNKEKAYLYQRAGILKFDTNKLDSKFLHCYLTSSTFIKQLSIELVGSDQPYIKSDLFKKTRNIFPCLEEQTKIANFLSSIDTKIEQNQKALEKTKEFKKALLQQMFV